MSILFSIILFFFLLLIIRDLFFFLPIFRRRGAVEVSDYRDEAAALVALMILKSDVITVCHVIMQIDVVFHYQVEHGTLIDFRKLAFLIGDCTLVADKLKCAADAVHKFGILHKVHLIDMAGKSCHNYSLLLGARDALEGCGLFLHCSGYLAGAANGGFPMILR